MYEAEMVRVGPDILSAIHEGVPQLPTLMNTAYRREIRRLRRDLLDELEYEPGKPDHPFIWSNNAAANLRARRWWMKAVREGRVNTDGERYIRSGKMIEAWEKGVKFEETEDGGIFSVQNDSPGAEYVYGPRQVPSHEASGWPNADVTILGFSEKAESRLIDTFFTISDDVAGVTFIPFV